MKENALFFYALKMVFGGTCGRGIKRMDMRKIQNKGLVASCLIGFLLISSMCCH
jgi:hypothetical protein